MRFIRQVTTAQSSIKTELSNVSNPIKLKNTVFLPNHINIIIRYYYIFNLHWKVFRDLSAKSLPIYFQNMMQDGIRLASNIKY